VRRRYLSTAISLDATVNKLAVTAGDFAALLFTWMIPHADDDGSITADTEELLFTIVPGRRDKTIDNMGTARLQPVFQGERAFVVENFFRPAAYPSWRSHRWVSLFPTVIGSEAAAASYSPCAGRLQLT
jgi:hypothetical protein